jgi:hypothetical protein
MAGKQAGGALAGSMKILVTSAATLAAIVTWPLRLLTGDKALNGFFRQGIHELGNTFGQMSPDSNTVHTPPGGIWNPLQSDIAGDRKPYGYFYGSDHTVHPPGHRPLKPSEIARNDRPYDPGQHNEQDHGHEL